MHNRETVGPRIKPWGNLALIAHWVKHAQVKLHKAIYYQEMKK